MAVDLSSPGARTLFEYWVHGEGALKVRWGTDGSMDRCIRHLTGKVRDPGGLCAEYHKAATGEWPAEKGIESAAQTMEFGTRWMGLLAPVNAPTGDRRKFVPGALSHRPLPLPLMWQRMSVGGKHDGSVVIGTLDNIHIDNNNVIGEGDLFDPDTIGMPRLAEDIAEVRFLLQKGVIGPSVDLDDVTFEMRNGEAVIVKGRISAATLLPVPAFAEARAFRIFENGVLVASCGVDEGLVLPFEFITLREWKEQKHPRGFHGRFRETAHAPRMSAPHPPAAHRAKEEEKPRKRTTQKSQGKATSSEGGRHSKKEETAEDLNKLTVPQLRVLAKERGVYVPSRARKAEVIEKIIEDKKDAGPRTRTVKSKDITSAEQLTVVQLRAIAKDNGIPVPSKLRKADIIKHIQSWEKGRGKKVLPGSSETDSKDAAERVSRNAAKEVTGSPRTWDEILTEETGFDWVPIRSLEVPHGEGYVIQHGRAYRIDGVTYLVENGSFAKRAFGGTITHEDIVRELQEVHDGLPGASRYQTGYAWLAGPNPKDSFWAKQYQMPGFSSLATAGHGGVRIWNRMGAARTPKWHKDSLAHEFGHNVSQKVAHRSDGDLSAISVAWRHAYHADTSAKRPSSIEFTHHILHETHGIDIKVDRSRLFPHGVSEYGKSSVGEDYAESVSHYLHGPVGWGRRTPDGPLEQIYFRDLFPHRAAILDRIFPEIARAQKAAKRAQKPTR